MSATAICPVCEEDLPREMFGTRKSGARASRCRPCAAAAERSRRAAKGIPAKNLSRIEDGKKLCLTCEKMKSLKDFTPMPRGLGGCQSHCKPCFRLHYGQTREQSRVAAAAHRARHPERVRARQRIHQFERNRLVRTTADGTVTDEFMKALYETEDCTYCGRATERSKRTADHAQPLSRGGSHSAANLVMACHPCNSAKQDKTAEEFLESLNAACC